MTPDHRAHVQASEEARRRRGGGGCWRGAGASAAVTSGLDLSRTNCQCARNPGTRGAITSSNQLN